MGCAGSSDVFSPEMVEALAKTGHSTGEFCKQLTLREWDNLSFESKNHIKQVDMLRAQEKIKFDSIAISEENGLKGNYAGEVDENGRAFGEGTYLEKDSLKEYRGTFKDNKMFGYVTCIMKEEVIGKDGRKQK